MSTGPDGGELTDDLGAHVESERSESRSRERDAASFGFGVAGVLATAGLALMRLTHLRPGAASLTLLLFGSYIGGLFADRWHKRRD